MSTPKAPAAVHAARVRSGDVELASFTAGDRARPLVLLVHGYPDTHAVWTDVMALLARRFFVVAYDVRGAGQSTRPSNTADYDLDRLAEDAAAVLDAAGAPRVHLVGHDWGSIQGWHFITTPGLAERFASFTSISGPYVDHAGHWLRRKLSHPTLGALGEVADQSARSWYIGALSTPALPELLWRRVLGRRFRDVLRDVEKVPEGPHPAPTLAEDGACGANLYRRNMPRVFHPRPDPVARVPVQLVVPAGDRFISRSLLEEVERWTPALRRRDVPGGHWVVRSAPDLVAEAIAAFVDDVESGAVKM
jgi:pimeloyl-ACP methyl ester carboxylesterase